MQVLIDELKKPEYQGKTDQQAADMINSKTVSIRMPVELWKVEEHASRKGYRAKLEKASRDPSNLCQETAINILEYIKSSRLNTVNMDLADTRNMLDAMVACRFATDQDIAELIALAEATIPWAEFHELGIVGVGLIHNARKEINHAQ